MPYTSSRAIEMAMKEAAKASPLDTGRLVSGFYSHRLLCRVFSGDEHRFVLKGGQSMLARTIDARMTRDIDLLSTRDNLDDALSDLISLAQMDLGDHVVFEIDKVRKIKVDDDYRSGVSVRATPIADGRPRQPISIDLVVDEVPLEGVERITPVDRVDVRGLETYDYVIYPVEAALSDKLTAIVERHGDRASSRVKDLVDICVYAHACDIDGDGLGFRIGREARVKAIELPTSFSLPPEWGKLHARQYAKLVAQTRLPKDCRSMEGGLAMARRLLDPVLMGDCAGMRWDHGQLAWLPAGGGKEVTMGARSGLRVAPYTPEHVDELREVCIAQASKRARTEKTYRAFTLAMYCDAYLERGVAYMLLDEDDMARGYVLAAEDARAWRRDFEPWREQIVALGPEYGRRVEEELDFYESVADDYPAHLHIDIAENLTGQGGGRMLIEALLERLRSDGVHGVVLGVSAANERAVGFYRHMGFTELTQYGDGVEVGYAFCMRL